MKARPLRRGTAERRPRWWIVPELEAWFRGERPQPITTCCYPFSALLDDLWAAWMEAHPDAVRPADWPTYPIAERERREALQYLTRRKPRWYGGKLRDIGRND